MTAEDGVANATYEITVSKDAPDTGVSDGTLKKLSVMAGSTELISNFVSGTGTTTYTDVNVSARTTSVRVDAVTSNSRADVEVTSDAGTVSGNGPYNAPLAAAGQNTEIVVTVTSANAEAANTQTYTITITRASSSDSTQDTLSSLVVDLAGGNQDAADNYELMPAFKSDAAPAGGGYVVYVATDIDMVHVSGTTTHTGATIAITDDEGEKCKHC